MISRLTASRRITGDIQQTQAKIATGRNVLKASDDPVAAANIAFTKDQKVVLERYATNIQRADQRLSLVETMLGDATNILTRVYELSIQASNDTYSASDRKAIGAEVTQLKDALLGLANAKDEAGKFLFSGFKVGQMPFVANADGSLEYKGDRGVHSVQVSESMKMNTGIDGAAVFLRADAGGNATSVFKVLETLEKNLNANELNRPEIAVNFKANGVKAEGSETMQIDLVGAASGTDDDLSFTTAALTAGDDTEIITAIKTAFDALADKKGYSASIENDVITFTRSDGR
jgi:flagellar hook-associated protein 3